MSKIYKNKTELINKLVFPGDTVLDVGFWGQGVSIDNPNWVHNILKSQTNNVYGVDMDFDESKIPNKNNYRRNSAEDFDFDVNFKTIFAGDIIEHLSNPGLFLDSCSRNLAADGRLIITTPNCFNFFNIAEKIRKKEPTVNSDHTCYFNSKTLKQLLAKNNWEIISQSYLYSLEVDYKESWRKRILNVLYFLLSKRTPKFCVDLVVIARRIND